MGRRPSKIIESELEVSLDRLEDYVRRFWAESVEDPAHRASAQPLTRSVTGNLIAVAPLADMSLLGATLDRLILTSPCVAFVVLVAADHQPLRATFRTQCEETQNGLRVLLEQVTLVTSLADSVRIPSLIRPLLVDDLPTQAFWGARVPVDLELLSSVVQLADQLVFDSALFTDPVADVARLERLGPRCHDLTWLRLAPWRRALAEAMESGHAPWPPVTRVRARLHHAGGAGSRAATARLGAWLHDRLDAIVEIAADPPCLGPTFEPRSVEVTVDDAVIRLEHLWPIPGLRASIDGADGGRREFHVHSHALPRGELLARAAKEVDAIATRNA